MCLLNINKYHGDCKTDATFFPCTPDHQAAVISFRYLRLAVPTHSNRETVSLSSEAALLLTAAQGSKPPHWAGDLSDCVTSDRRNVLSGLPQRDYQSTELSQENNKHLMAIEMDKVGAFQAFSSATFLTSFLSIQTSVFFLLQHKDYRWQFSVVRFKQLYPVSLKSGLFVFFWLYLTGISVLQCSILQLLLHPAMFSHHNSLDDSSVTDLGTEGETATSPAHINNNTCVLFNGNSSSVMESSFCTVSHLTFPNLAHSKANNHYDFNKDCFPETKSPRWMAKI